MFSTITACRMCQDTGIEPILRFGNMPLANRYLKSLSDKELFVPMEVVLCMECGAVQLAHTVDPKILFEEYLYTSSTSGSLADHFKDYAKDTTAKLSLVPRQDFIVGIGGNDGPLERAYQNLGFKVLNVEASKNIADLSRANEVPTWNEWFTEEVSKSIVHSQGQASLITCNNCFAHMPDIHGVMRAIKVLLKPDGWFVCENAYWMDTVEGNNFDQIYHEHCFYWTIKALDNLFRSHNLTIADVEFNQSQGGSIRVFVRRESATVRSSWVSDFIYQEESRRLFEPSMYISWSRQIEDWKATCKAFLEPLNSVCCYGAPAKFTMISELLKFSALSPQDGRMPQDVRPAIAYVVEDSPIKVGRFTPGSHIPIVNNCHFIANPTRYCIITATNYASRIIEANPQYKGDWIVLTPEPSFLTK